MVEVNVSGDDNICKLLAIRAKELGQTTKQSAVALVVTMLKSLRGNTRVASETKGRRITAKEVTDKYRPTWNSKNNAKKFCFTAGVGKNAAEVKIPSDVRLHFDKEVFGYRSFYCEDRRSPDITYKWLVVTDSIDKARQIVAAFHAKRVNRYKNLAKYALGIAMAKLAKSTGLENVSDNVKKSTIQNITVDVKDSGLNEGDISIRVKDALDYAGKALRGGEGFINEAKNRAVNQTVGLLLQKLKHRNNLDESLRISLEELKA